MTVLEILVALLLLAGTVLVLRTLWEFDALAAPPAPGRSSESSGTHRRRAA